MNVGQLLSMQKELTVNRPRNCSREGGGDYSRWAVWRYAPLTGDG
jgi:hypothetical protein